MVSRTYEENDGPDRNPLKGWNSGWSDDREETTVGFQYIKWQDLEPRNGVFDFGAVEDVIARSGSRNRHVILRLYCDWWGANETSRGCPDWIYSEVGVERIRGDNGRYLTDYNDPRYVDEAVQAIQALAGRYDDDPRIYAFQLGVLGYWGEWHTWGSRVDGGSYEITDATKRRVLNAYTDAFDRAALMGRYPNRAVLDTADGIGFHNDYFRPNNGHSAEFDETVSLERKWLAGPIGGEVPPGLSSDDFRNLYATSQGREMIETGHYSTMKPTSVDDRYLGQHQSLHKRFGYNYQIEEARLPVTHTGSGPMVAELTVGNIGIAPFYFDWQVQFALLGDDGEVVSVAEAEAYDLRRHQPGDSFDLEGNLPMAGVERGRYRLAVRIIQPGADRAKPTPWKLDARNTYILFANEMPVVDGAWNGTNQLEGGWSVLGEVGVGGP